MFITKAYRAARGIIKKFILDLFNIHKPSNINNPEPKKNKLNFIRRVSHQTRKSFSELISVIEYLKKFGGYAYLSI